MRRAAALVLLVGITLTGCSSGTAEDPRSPTCDALQAAVEGAQREAEAAITDLGTDPTAADQVLADVRTALVDAQGDVSGEEGAYLTRADAAIARLARQVAKTESGGVVDGTVVGEVRAELLRVVEDVRADC